MTFKAGKSGNPKGRPRGTGSRQEVFNILVGPHKNALFAKAVDLALEGNEAMLKLLLERMLPAKPRDEPINFEFNAADGANNESLLPLSLNVLVAASEGRVTPKECQNIASLIKAHHNNIGLEETIRSLHSDIRKLYAISKCAR